MALSWASFFFNFLILDIMLAILIFIFGLAIGSFLNVVIWRLYKDESLAWGRSRCPDCRHNLAWFDNIPLISFIRLGGRCRYCRKKISWQYPLVELATALLFVLVYYRAGALQIFDDWRSIVWLIQYWFIISALIIIFVYDLRWYLVDDRVVLPAIIIVFFSQALLGISPLGMIAAALAIAVFFLSQHLISRGKWLGSGDIRIGILMGVILGWPEALVALFLSYIIGSIVGLALLAAGKKKFSSKIPFGPFLALGTLVALFWSRELIKWYIGLAR